MTARGGAEAGGAQRPAPGAPVERVSSPHRKDVHVEALPALLRRVLRDHLFVLRKKGFNRLYQAGQVFEFSTPESLLDIDFSQPLFVLVDRIAVSA